MVDRKKELKKWFIDHPELTSVAIAERYGCTKQAAYHRLFRSPSAPQDFLDLCMKMGLPASLLPPPTRPKAEILEENARLKHELRQTTIQLHLCWDALDGDCLSGSCEASR